MRQVIFRVPIPGIFPEGVPVYGFGLMLFVAFVLCTWLAGRRAEKQGIGREVIQDLAIWIFAGGLIGARIVYMIQYHRPIEEFLKIWEGGIVFYGSMIGGVIGAAGGYYFILRKKQLSWWRLADIIAPTVALGLSVGRLGCLLNGCCFGNVACPDCPAIHFPLSAPPRGELVSRGLDTAAGFVLYGEEPTVSSVEPNSPAAKAGLKPDDVIVRAEGRAIDRAADLRTFMERRPDNAADITFTVRRSGKLIELPGYVPIAPDFRLVDDRTVRAVAQGSPAAEAGLQPGDVLVKADGQPLASYAQFEDYLTRDWPRGKNDLGLTVARDGQDVDLPPFSPRTIGLHPTQIYETVSMFLLFLLMLAYYPLRRHDGEVMAIFLICYPIHRFLNEMLRNDTDKDVAFGMTLSQNGSILVFAVGLLLALWLWRRPVQYKAA